MCNHYRNNEDKLSSWREYIGAAPYEGEWSETKVDIWPKYQARIVRIVDGSRVEDSMQWGVPLKMAGKRPGTTVTKRITNVRNLASPFWRSVLAKPEQRCLVPFTSFAEPKPGAGRAEIWFSVKEAEVSAFAGIWRPSEEGDVFAFLTCEPNPLVAAVHPKAMPVILQPEDYGRWLDGEDAAGLATPFPSQLMAQYDGVPD